MVFVRQLFKGTRKDAPAVQTLGLPDKDLTTKPSEDMSAGISPELAKEAARRIKAAAEMGDVTELVSIAEALKKRSESCEPISIELCNWPKILILTVFCSWPVI